MANCTEERPLMMSTAVYTRDFGIRVNERIKIILIFHLICYRQ